MKAKIGGTLYRDMGDKVKVMKIVRVIDESGKLLKFMVIGVDVKKRGKQQLPHEAAKDKKAEVEEKVKNMLKKRGYEVVE